MEWGGAVCLERATLAGARLIAGDFDPARLALQPVPTTRVAQRQGMRGGLDMRVRTEAARILKQRGVNPAGRELDRQ